MDVVVEEDVLVMLLVVKDDEVEGRDGGYRGVGVGDMVAEDRVEG